MMKAQAQECLRIFNKRSRMYKYDYMERSDLKLSKIWNRGMGLSPTIRIYPEEKIILVNSALWTKRDERVLQSILVDMGMTDWKRETRYYGYPVYYNNKFGLQLKR